MGTVGSERASHLCNTLKPINQVRMAKITRKKLNCKTATPTSLLGPNALPPVHAGGFTSRLTSHHVHLLTQVYWDCHVKVQISEQKENKRKEPKWGGSVRLRTRTFWKWEIDDVCPSRCTASFPYKTLETSCACLLVRRGAGQEVKLAGEASPQGRGVLHRVPV